MKNIPSRIIVNRVANLLIIDWVEDHHSEYPFALLRYACPCVDCRGGHDQMSDQPDPVVFARPIEDLPQTRISSVTPVGSYAITVEWEDGHNAGIYTWDFLRALCPCPVCRNR